MSPAIQGDVSDVRTLETHSSDHSLVRLLRGGDERAAEVLYRRYIRRVNALIAGQLPDRLGPRLSPDDIAQSVFRVFFHGLAERTYDVPRDRELWGLLCALALSKVRDRVAYHQAARRDVRRTAAATEQTLAAEPDAESESGRLCLEVDDLLRAFHADDRQIVSLRMAGYEVPEISELTGRSLRTVERVLQKARNRLRNALR
jgi:RNA polymerase sigma-70 factor (ECF subfamily)